MNAACRVCGVVRPDVHGICTRPSCVRSALDADDRALRVLTMTPHIREYLLTHDPKALEQAERALLPRLDK